jgi:D-sedoheptulose 7-phosphate isomerase
VSRARVDEGLEALAALARESRTLSGTVAGVAERYAAVLQGGGTLFFCGNGGSAADAQHLAAEYVVRYASVRRPFAAIALTTDTSILTAAGNDFGFEQMFARQVEALAGEGDLLVLHSTSGESANLLAAARVARDRGVATVAFLGKGGGRLAAAVDQAVIVPSLQTGQIQLIHLALEHLIVELVEQQLSGNP